MATLNNGIKINTAVTNGIIGTGATLYTAPSNAYAIVQLSIISTGAGDTTISVGGRTVYVVSLAASTKHNLLFNIYVGPGQILAYTAPAVSSIDVSGVSFINTF